MGHITLFVHASSSFVYMYHHVTFMFAVREGQGSGGSWEGATERMEVNQPRGMPQHVVCLLKCSCCSEH